MNIPKKVNYNMITQPAVTAPIQEAPSSESIAAFVHEISKAAGITSFELPSRDIVFAKAQILASELKEIPPAWVGRVYVVARHEYASEPKILHLSKAWSNVVIKEYRAEQILNSKMVQPEVTYTDEEKEKGWREMWLGIRAQGLRLSPNIAKRYQFSDLEIKECKDAMLSME